MIIFLQILVEEEEEDYFNWSGITDNWGKKSWDITKFKLIFNWTL